MLGVDKGSGESALEEEEDHSEAHLGDSETKEYVPISLYQLPPPPPRAPPEFPPMFD
jgi:hypothetical protein